MVYNMMVTAMLEDMVDFSSNHTFYRPP